MVREGEKAIPVKSALNALWASDNIRTMSALFIPSPSDQVRARCTDLLSQLRPQLASPSSASSVDFSPLHSRNLKAFPNPTRA